MRDFRCQTFWRWSACSSLQIVSMFMLLSLSWLKVGRRHAEHRFQNHSRRRPVISESLPRDSIPKSDSKLASSPVALYVRCKRRFGSILSFASHVCWATCLFLRSLARLHSSKSPVVFRLVVLLFGFTLCFDEPSVLSHAVPDLFQFALLDALLDSLAIAHQRSQRPAQIRVEPMPFRSLFL